MYVYDRVIRGRVYANVLGIVSDKLTIWSLDAEIAEKVTMGVLYCSAALSAACQTPLILFPQSV